MADAQARDPETESNQQCRWQRVRQAVKRGPLSRSELYELAGEYKGLFRKRGAVTIVDMVRYDQILTDLPAAKLKRKAT